VAAVKPFVQIEKSFFFWQTDCYTDCFKETHDFQLPTEFFGHSLIDLLY
jgi:hypothetical protein